MANNQGYYSNHKMMSLIKNNEAQKNILKKQLLQGRKLTNALESPTQYNKAHNLEMNLNVLKKSLENITEAKNTSEIIEKALLNIITIFQNLLDLNLQARQPGLSNLDLVLITDSIKSLETELQASLELYKYNNKTLFHCKDRLNYREKKICELTKILRWNISVNNLETTWITLSKPKIVLKGLEKNFLKKIDKRDRMTYSVDLKSVGEETVKQLEYNAKVIKNDIVNLNKYLNNILSFKKSLSVKFNSLKIVFDNDLNRLNSMVGINKSEHLIKINMLDSQIKMARKLFLNNN